MKGELVSGAKSSRVVCTRIGSMYVVLQKYSDYHRGYIMERRVHLKKDVEGIFWRGYGFSIISLI
jgi:hypothetical protein